MTPEWLRRARDHLESWRKCLAKRCLCNVQALPRDDSGPPSEVGARRQKFAAFENACSEVAPGLCVGGGAVAQASTMCSVNVAVASDP